MEDKCKDCKCKECEKDSNLKMFKFNEDGVAEYIIANDREEAFDIYVKNSGLDTVESMIPYIPNVEDIEDYKEDCIKEMSDKKRMYIVEDFNEDLLKGDYYVHQILRIIEEPCYFCADEW